MTRFAATLGLVLAQAGMASAWSPDAVLTRQEELPYGRWATEVPEGLERTERSDAVAAYRSSERGNFFLGFRELFESADFSAAGRERAARRRCDGSTLIPDDELRSTGLDAWTIRCPGSSNEVFRHQIDRWWYVAHPDGWVLEIGAFGAEQHQMLLARRILATLRPLRSEVPRQVVRTGVELRAPPTFVAYSALRMDSLEMSVSEVVPLAMERSELVIRRSTMVSPRPPGRGTAAWSVSPQRGWVGRREDVEGWRVGTLDLQLDCEGSREFLAADAWARSEDDLGVLADALANVELDEEASRRCQWAAPRAARARSSQRLAWLVICVLLGLALIAGREVRRALRS